MIKATQARRDEWTMQYYVMRVLGASQKRTSTAQYTNNFDGNSKCQRKQYRRQVVEKIF